MRRMLRVCLAAAVIGLAAATSAGAQQQTPLLQVTPEPEVWPTGTWAGWKEAFLKPDGRIVDNANGDISHSEGQGYGMLLAVIANDQASFAQIYDWTRKTLMVRADGLASWKWEADKTPNLTDQNNASDGDLLIAWALLEAAERWNKPEYRQAAERLATALDAKVGIRSAFGRVMLPGVDGFTVEQRKDQGDGPVVNLSYWIFPALERLSAAAPRVDWQGYRASGYTLLRAAKGGTAALPTDWTSIKDGKATPAKDFPPAFSYNAVRIPLYLAWAKRDSREELAPFVDFYARNGERAFEFDLEKNQTTGEMTDAGYRAIFSLAKCAVDGTPIPNGLRSVSFDRYYSSTLHMLALTAARVRFGKCLSEHR